MYYYTYSIDFPFIDISYKIFSTHRNLVLYLNRVGVLKFILIYFSSLVKTSTR